MQIATSQADLGRLVPWRAVNLVGPTFRVWEEYDYRPRAEGGFREDIDATLDRLVAIGVRQVQINTFGAWSVERAPYPGTSIRSTVYYRSSYRPDDPSTWGAVPRTRRGDMGLVPWAPPASWDQPTPLRTPLDLNRKAEQVLSDMLDAVARKGLIPVLKVETYLHIADDAADTSEHFNFTDPSRNFNQFYAKYQEYLVSMARVAARHQAGLFIMGTEVPYIAGGGQSIFSDGSRMTDRRALIDGKWRAMIAAVRAAAAAEGRPDLALSYTEINPMWETRTLTEARQPPWRKTPFWDALDAVGINFYLPGRLVDADGNVDTGPKTVDDMVRYGETHNFASDSVANLQDLRDFFVTQRGYGLATKPVLFPEDGCTSSFAAAANPAAPPFLRLRQQPDFAEQQKLYEAHFRLGQSYGTGWLGGFGFWQVTPTSLWGGPWNPADTTNYSEAAAYFNFLGTPAEDTVRAYFGGSAPPPNPELLTNPGFESGAAPWSLQRWDGQSQLAVVSDAGRVRGGSMALRIVNPNASSDGAAVSPLLAVTAGGTYQASAYLYLQGVTAGGAVLMIDWLSASGAYLSSATSSVRSANGGYAPLALSAVAPAGATQALFFLFSYAVGTVYFDDASFRRAP